MLQFKKVGATILLAFNLFFALLFVFELLSELSFPFNCSVYNFLEWLFQKPLSSGTVELVWSILMWTGPAFTYLLLLLFQIRGRVIPRPLYVFPILPSAFYSICSDAGYVEMYNPTSPFMLFFLVTFFALFTLWLAGDIWALKSIWKKRKEKEPRYPEAFEIRGDKK